MEWGGSTRLNLRSRSHWGGMTPTKLQEHIDEIRKKLDPASANTDDMPSLLRMGTGFSKIYSAIIPGFPFYDSRVACALACLVRIYQQDERANVSEDILSFPVPEWRTYKGRGPNRCGPGRRMGHRKFAEANLKCGWLIHALLEWPGEFARVPEQRRVAALQSALFMLGYARLRDDAVVKPGQKSSAPRQK